MSRLRIGVMLALTFLVVMARPAHAVDIQITDGFVTVRHAPDLAHPFELIGPDFRFSGGGSDDGNSFTLTKMVNGVVGGTANMSGIFGGGFPSNLTYQGETRLAQTTLNFLTPNVSILQTGGFSYQATAPFTMTGTIFEGPTHLETFNLFGQGNVTLNWEGGPPTPGTLLNPLGGRFAFEAPIGTGGPVIPEPSTVLLVASGLAGLGLWGRRAAA